MNQRTRVTQTGYKSPHYSFIDFYRHHVPDVEEAMWEALKLLRENLKWNVKNRYMSDDSFDYNRAALTNALKLVQWWYHHDFRAYGEWLDEHPDKWLACDGEVRGRLFLSSYYSTRRGDKDIAESERRVESEGYGRGGYHPDYAKAWEMRTGQKSSGRGLCRHPDCKLSEGHSPEIIQPVSVKQDESRKQGESEMTKK